MFFNISLARKIQYDINSWLIPKLIIKYYTDSSHNVSQAKSLGPRISPRARSHQKCKASCRVSCRWEPPRRSGPQRAPSWRGGAGPGSPGNAACCRLLRYDCYRPPLAPQSGGGGGERELLERTVLRSRIVSISLSYHIFRQIQTLNNCRSSYILESRAKRISDHLAWLSKVAGKCRSWQVPNIIGYDWLHESYQNIIN